MNHSLKRNLDLIVINLLSILAGVGAYYLVDHKAEITLAIIAAGFSLALGLRQSRVENDRIFKELFTMFNEKYDVKFNDTLNNIALNLHNERPYSLSEGEKKLIIDYLNLCAEEYLWYTKHRIDEKVWTAWELGMNYFINLTPIKEVAMKEQEVSGSYYGLFEKLKFPQQDGLSTESLPSAFK